MINFSISRDFEIQLTDSLIRKKEKSLISTKDNNKFKNEDVFYHDNNNSIDEKSFVDDNDDIDIKFKSMTKEKIKFFQRKESFKNRIMRMLIRKLLN